MSNFFRAPPIAAATDAPVMASPTSLLRAHQVFLRSIEKNGLRWSFFDARGIARIYTVDKYARFLHRGVHGPSERWLQESLSALEHKLKPLGFIRVHRQELINLSFLRAITRRPGRARALRLELLDGQEVLVSRRCAAKLRAAVNRLLTWPTLPAAAAPPL